VRKSTRKAWRGENALASIPTCDLKLGQARACLSVPSRKQVLVLVAASSKKVTGVLQHRCLFHSPPSSKRMKSAAIFFEMHEVKFSFDPETFSFLDFECWCRSRFGVERECGISFTLQGVEIMPCARSLLQGPIVMHTMSSLIDAPRLHLDSSLSSGDLAGLVSSDNEAEAESETEAEAKAKADTAPKPVSLKPLMSPSSSTSSLKTPIFELSSSTSSKKIEPQQLLVGDGSYLFVAGVGALLMASATAVANSLPASQPVPVSYYTYVLLALLAISIAPKSLQRHFHFNQIFSSLLQLLDLQTYKGIIIDCYISFLCWSITYLFVRRWLNPDTVNATLSRFASDGFYGGLAASASVLLRKILHSKLG